MALDKLKQEIRAMRTITPAVLLPLLLVGGCIVGDQLTTITVHPDGSADLAILRSNLHSTEKGAKAEKELAAYKARFDSRADDDFTRVRDAGGTAVESSWIHSQPPFSSFIHAHFPTASVLEKYMSAKDDKGNSVMTTQFRSDGERRRLTFRITVPPDKNNGSRPAPVSPEQLRQAIADGISETRIAMTSGSISASRGFVVAGDKQSALLNVSEIAEILRAGQGKAELYLDWELTR
jgi:hypothetical protein